MPCGEEKLYRAGTVSIPGIGTQRLRWLIAQFGCAEEAWKAPRDAYIDMVRESCWIDDYLRARSEIDLYAIERRLKREDIALAVPGDDAYPALLTGCTDAPLLLFYKGKLSAAQPAIGIVGARHASHYGKAAATYLGKGVSEAGFAVVSGLARGIDAAAHSGALENGGITWAFLAGGLDTVYPKENTRLALSILEKGALISEYPPGVPPEARQFPARNRLISGTSHGVIVVEAAERSGSLITADFALEQGREVFAVPGPIFSELSRGTHQLLRMGAKLAENIQDILSELPLNQDMNVTEEAVIKSGENPKNNSSECAHKKKQSPKKTDKMSWADQTLSVEWKEILEYMSDIPLHIDRLTILCPLPAHEIALGLLELQLAGKILQLPGQHYVLQR